jgi:four helix bundle protein
VHALYQTYASWSKLVIKFPKSQRYTLGEVCQVQLLSALEAVLAAASASEPKVKSAQLRLAASKLDLLRLLIRLAKDCKCLDNKAYLELESQLHEIGRMLGGWLKSLQ